MDNSRATPTVHQQLLQALQHTNWLSRVGIDPGHDLDLPVQPVTSAAAALRGANSGSWQDVRAEAKGDLTGFLAVRHPKVYADWNSVGAAGRQFVDSQAMPKIRDACERLGIPDLAESCRFDLVMIAQYLNYRHLKGAPRFYEAILKAYQSGHVPCGWTQPIEAWPEGQLQVW